MSKFQKILLGVFCGGVLLCGIGAGVAFVEFSSITYAGEKILGETDMVTKDFDVEFEPDGEAYWVSAYRYSDSGVDEIQYSAQVPVNTVRFRVSYNSSRVKPVAGVDPEGHSFYAYCTNFSRNDDLKLFMEGKDQILSDLKERKISLYRTMGMEEVEILANPANREDLRFVY